MQAHDERAHVPLGQVLDLINDERDGGATGGGGPRHGQEQFGQVGLKVAAVGGAAFPVYVQGQFGIGVLDLDP